MWQKMLQIGSGSTPVETTFWIFKEGEGLQNGIDCTNLYTEYSTLTITSNSIVLDANQFISGGYSVAACEFSLDCSAYRNKKLHIEYTQSIVISSLGMSRFSTYATYPTKTNVENMFLSNTTTRKTDTFDLSSYVHPYIGCNCSDKNNKFTFTIHNMWID